MNDTIIIPLDKRKLQVQLRALGFCTLVFGSIIVFLIVGDYLDWFFKGALICLFGMFLYNLIVGYRELPYINKKTEGVVLSPEGIRINMSSVGRKLGKISWKEISGIDNDTGKILYIRLKYLDKFVIDTYEKRQERIWGIGLDNEILDITFEELGTLVNEYFEKYG